MQYHKSEDFYIAFGKQVRFLRKEKGFSQRELGLRADIEKSTVQRIERGLMNCTLKTLLRLANALELGTFELFSFHSTTEK